MGCLAIILRSTKITKLKSSAKGEGFSPEGCIKKNEILLASNADKETLICLDVTIEDETLE